MVPWQPIRLLVHRAGQAGKYFCSAALIHGVALVWNMLIGKHGPK